MDLGGRAFLAVPVIALAIAIFSGVLQIVTSPGDAVLSGWNGGLLVVFYSFGLALGAGLLLSFPMTVLGRFLPQPSWVPLLIVGLAASCLAGFVMVRGTGPDWLVVLGMFSAIGSLAGYLWWLLVKRFREYPDQP